MMLPLPNLDDRRFQDLVDDAKRMVQQQCPEWTDHNVSDPGVTLIETFAFMVDELLYRLNRVPDRLYVTFLDLLGRHPSPAHGRARRPDRLVVGAAGGAGDLARTVRGRHSAHRPQRGDPVRDHAGSGRSRPGHLAFVLTQGAGSLTPVARGDELSSEMEVPVLRPSLRCPTTS